MRTTNTATFGTHSMSREQAEPFAIRTLRETFLNYPPREQERIRADVAQKLADELRSKEFRARTERGDVRHTSALARLAEPVYGIRLGDIR